MKLSFLTIKVIIPSQFESSTLKFLLRVYIEGPIDNSINLRTSASNRARKPLKEPENIETQKNQNLLSQKESNDDEECFSMLDHEESDDSFFSESDENVIKESNIDTENADSDSNKENVDSKRKIKSARRKIKRDHKETNVSAACFVM